MNTLETRQNQPLRCGKVIGILAIASLGCVFLNLFVNWIQYFIWTIQGINSVGVFFSILFRHLLAVPFQIAPPALLLLYVFFFHKKGKGTVLVPILLIALSLRLFTEAWNALRGVGWYISAAVNILSCIVDATAFLALSMAAVSVFIGWKKKIFIPIAMGCCLFSLLFELIDFFSYIFYWNWSLTYFLQLLLTLPGSAALYAAILLLALTDGIPPVFARSSKKAPAPAMEPDPVAQLQLLKQKLELEIITEEEYQAQRDAIISNL